MRGERAGALRGVNGVNANCKSQIAGVLDSRGRRRAGVFDDIDDGNLMAEDADFWERARWVKMVKDVNRRKRRFRRSGRGMRGSGQFSPREIWGGVFWTGFLDLRDLRDSRGRGWLGGHGLWGAVRRLGAGIYAISALIGPWGAKRFEVMARLKRAKWCVAFQKWGLEGAGSGWHRPANQRRALIWHKMAIFQGFISAVPTRGSGLAAGVGLPNVNNLSVPNGTKMGAELDDFPLTNGW